MLSCWAPKAAQLFPRHTYSMFVCRCTLKGLGLGRRWGWFDRKSQQQKNQFENTPSIPLVCCRPHPSKTTLHPVQLSSVGWTWYSVCMSHKTAEIAKAFSHAVRGYMPESWQWLWYQVDKSFAPPAAWKRGHLSNPDWEELFFLWETADNWWREFSIRLANMYCTLVGKMKSYCHSIWVSPPKECIFKGSFDTVYVLFNPLTE